MYFFCAQIANGQGIVRLYSVRKNIERYGKGSGFLQFNPETGKVFYQIETFNEDTGSCEVIRAPEVTVTERREYRPECLWYKNNVVTEGRTTTRFISQDSSKYFWWFICFRGSVRSFDACEKALVYLYIRSGAGPAELNLAGLPWDDIAEDLRDFTGRSMEQATYTWLGRDCTLLRG